MAKFRFPKAAESGCWVCKRIASQVCSKRCFAAAEGWFARTIGTEDPNIIETIIDPGANDIHSIDLHIFWPDEGGPPPSIELHHQEHEVQKVQILQQ
jgi:hypothetical protein